MNKEGRKHASAFGNIKNSSYSGSDTFGDPRVDTSARRNNIIMDMDDPGCAYYCSISSCIEEGKLNR